MKMKRLSILLVIGLIALGSVNLLFAAAHECTSGMADIYPCQEIDLLSFVPLADLGGGSGADIWGWTDPMTGNEYALVNRTNGTAFVDVSEPTAPVVVGRLPTQSGVKVQRDVKVLGNYALVGAEATQHGLQIFDLTRLRGLTETVVFSADAVYTEVLRIHNVVVNEANPTYAVLVGTSEGNSCNSGLHVVDMTQPITPTFAGCFSADGYTHDAQCITYDGPDSDYTGRELCFASNTDTLTVVDITDPANMVQIARETYSGAAYTHQGWLTEDRHYFMLNDEVDELSNGTNTRTFVMDVQDLDNVSFHMLHEHATASADHNLYIRGNYAYLANYNAGLRIMDISNIASKSITEVAYFDVYPQDDSVSFQGAWSVYPYFQSGTLIVSTRDRGLFVLGATGLSVVPTAVGLEALSAENNTTLLPFIWLLLAVATFSRWLRAAELTRGQNGITFKYKRRIKLPRKR